MEITAAQDLKVFKAVLNDAEIKALPSDDLVLLQEPGQHTYPVPLWALLISYCQEPYDNFAVDASFVVGNDLSLLTSVGAFDMLTQTDDYETTVLSTLEDVDGSLNGALVNQGEPLGDLILELRNADGNLTGGHVNNRLVVWVGYITVAL